MWCDQTIPHTNSRVLQSRHDHSRHAMDNVGLNHVTTMDNVVVNHVPKCYNHVTTTTPSFFPLCVPQISPLPPSPTSNFEYCWAPPTFILLGTPPLRSYCWAPPSEVAQHAPHETGVPNNRKQGRVVVTITSQYPWSMFRAVCYNHADNLVLNNPPCKFRCVTIASQPVTGTPWIMWC